jgi:hypothetical protein
MSYSLKEGLRQALLANAALVAIVGSRITSSFAPQNTPAGQTWIVISQISGQEDSAMDGNANLTRPRFQLTVGGADQEQVDAVRDILVQFNGVTYDYVALDGTHTLTFFHADDNDGWEEPSRLYKVMVDLYVWANT